MSRGNFRERAYRCAREFAIKPKARKQFGADIALVPFDFENEKTFSEALEGVEKVFLLPPLLPNQLEVVNAFVDAAKRAGVRHIVKLSAIGIDDEAQPTAIKGQYANEQHIRESGLEVHVFAAEFFHAKFHHLLSSTQWRDLSAMGEWDGQLCRYPRYRECCRESANKQWARRKNLHAHWSGDARNCRGSTGSFRGDGPSLPVFSTCRKPPRARRNASSEGAAVAGRAGNGTARSQRAEPLECRHIRH